MRTTLNKVSIQFPAFLTLLHLFSLFVFEKCDYRLVVKTSYLKSRFFVTFEVIFLNAQKFPDWGFLFLVLTVNEEYFNGKMSFLAGLDKKVLTFPQKYRFFDYLTPAWKSDFSMYRRNIKKCLVKFLGEAVENNSLDFELFVLSRLWGSGHLASQCLQKP